MEETRPSRSLGKKILLGVSLYLGVILLVGVILFVALRLRPPQDDSSENLGFSAYTGDRSKNQNQGELIPAWAPSLGPVDAKVTIVEFGDFQCPFCKASFEPVRRLLNAHPEQVRLVYRHFPLASIHPLARELAHASMCAHEQGKFWQFHDRLFQFQDEITEDNLSDQARAVGLQMAMFTSCQQSGRWYDEIDKDLGEAVSRGGRGTPSWVVNGQLIEGYLSFDSWQHILDSFGL